MKLKTVTLRGYKSIASLESFELGKLNVLIGANGAGKSNFLSIFKFLVALADGNLQTFVKQQGGPDALLHYGRKYTQQTDIEIFLEKDDYTINEGYRISLIPTSDNRLIFGQEQFLLNNTGVSDQGKSHDEAKLSVAPRKSNCIDGTQIYRAIKNWRQYHFHDTSDSAMVKRPHGSNDNLRLKPDAHNLAAYLARLHREYPLAYQRIVNTIKLAAPFFGNFVIRDPLPDTIELEWFEQRDQDTPYKAHMLSDGTLRFICLTTLLLQPTNLLSATILIDEPELGLHPYAIHLLASMIKQVAETQQVIIATQSVELLNAFEAQDVVVVERENDTTVLKRLDQENLKDWLHDYSLGELWMRNILGGGPTR